MVKEKTIIGLDVGGSKTAVVEGNRSGIILQRTEMATHPDMPFARTFPRLTTTIQKMIQTSRTEGRVPVALSVSIGGPLQIQPGILINPPHLPGWHNVHLKEELQRRFPSLPVYLEHDGNAGALAEFHFGVGKGKSDLRHLVFLTFGTGCGAGIIVNGEIVHGASDTAGEIGHIRLAEHGPKGFGKEGSWEGFASGKGMVMLAQQRFPRRWPQGTPVRKLVAAMLQDDPEALTIAEETGRWLGKGIAILLDAFNPQLVVLGSLAVILGDRVLGPAREVIAREALPQAVHACKILPAALGREIGDVAALMAAFHDPRIRKKMGPGELRSV